jgi:hypothetical protein
VSEDDGAAESTPVRRALDLFIFAPVGVALTVAEDLPSLIAKGRQRVETEIRNARAVGEFVVTRGQNDIAGKVGKLLNRETGDGETGDTDTETGQPHAANEDNRAEPTASSNGTAPAPDTTAPLVATKPAPDPADGALVEQALAGYDTLSASQVVRRLESLDPDDLRALYRHEASHRNRRTILNRTTQLLEGAGAGGGDGAGNGDGAAADPTAPSEADTSAP